jgi:hypothetical protein
MLRGILQAFEQGDVTQLIRNDKPEPFFKLSFNGRISQEKLKTIFCYFLISRTTLTGLMQIVFKIGRNELSNPSSFCWFLIEVWIIPVNTRLKAFSS